MPYKNRYEWVWCALAVAALAFITPLCAFAEKGIGGEKCSVSGSSTPGTPPSTSLVFGSGSSCTENIPSITYFGYAFSQASIPVTLSGSVTVGFQSTTVSGTYGVTIMDASGMLPFNFTASGHSVSVVGESFSEQNVLYVTGPGTNVNGTLLVTNSVMIDGTGPYTFTQPETVTASYDPTTGNWISMTMTGDFSPVVASDDVPFLPPWALGSLIAAVFLFVLAFRAKWFLGPRHGSA